MTGDDDRLTADPVVLDAVREAIDRVLGRHLGGMSGDAEAQQLVDQIESAGVLLVRSTDVVDVEQETAAALPREVTVHLSPQTITELATAIRGKDPR